LHSHGFRPCHSKYHFTPQFRAPVEGSKSVRSPGGAGQTKGTEIGLSNGKAAAIFKLDGRVVAGPRLGNLEMGGTNLGDQPPVEAGPSTNLRRPPPQVAACVQVGGPVPPVLARTSPTAMMRACLRGLRSARDSLLDFFW
jgi:hypothetical protein